MIENMILSGLVHDEEYTRKVIPFLKKDYFSDNNSQRLFELIEGHISSYNTLPTKDTLKILVDHRNDLNEESFKELNQRVDSLSFDEKTDREWFIDSTEKFCQDKAIYNAVRQSILVLDDEDGNLDKGSIPKMLSDALGVSFDTHIGHDFTENGEERYKFYHTKEDKIEFDLEYLNKITKGGVSRKALCIVLAGTGVGKTLFMGHCAAANLMAGKNVLYITLEMAEERIAERIDANLLDLTMDELRYLTKETYMSRLGSVKKNTTGKLIIKEYPTASASSAHFRFLLNELRLKKNFIPDIIYVDYLNICTSARIRPGANVNSYTYIKAIAEELRGLAVEFNVPIISATQTTRSGFTSSDLGLEDTSESFGLPATADFMIGLISSEELEQLSQIMVKQLKNRWGDINAPSRFVIGIDRPRMKLYDAEESAQDGLMKDSPKKEKSLMDNTEFGKRYDQESDRKRTRKPSFEGFE